MEIDSNSFSLPCYLCVVGFISVQSDLSKKEKENR